MANNPKVNVDTLDFCDASYITDPGLAAMWSNAWASVKGTDEAFDPKIAELYSRLCKESRKSEKNDKSKDNLTHKPTLLNRLKGFFGRKK